MFPSRHAFFWPRMVMLPSWHTLSCPKMVILTFAAYPFLSKNGHAPIAESILSVNRVLYPTSACPFLARIGHPSAEEYPILAKIGYGHFWSTLVCVQCSFFPVYRPHSLSPSCHRFSNTSSRKAWCQKIIHRCVKYFDKPFSGAWKTLHDRGKSRNFAVSNSNKDKTFFGYFEIFVVFGIPKYIGWFNSEKGRKDEKARKNGFRIFRYFRCFRNEIERWR